MNNRPIPDECDQIERPSRRRGFQEAVCNFIKGYEYAGRIGPSQMATMICLFCRRTPNEGHRDGCPMAELKRALELHA